MMGRDNGEGNGCAGRALSDEELISQLIAEGRKSVTSGGSL